MSNTIKLSKHTNKLRQQEVILGRKCLTELNSHCFIGKSDPLIRAAKLDVDKNWHGKVTIFDYEDTICIAALIRWGIDPRNAAAAVNEGYVEVCRIGGSFDPSILSKGNFDLLDVVTLSDGSEYAIFMDDVPPLNFDSYDCWALKSGKPVHVEVYDPTKRLMQGIVPYRHAVNRAALS